VRYQEYGVLATLRSKGPPFQMSPSELQASLIYSSGGLSNLLKRLERSGYVRRSEDPSDGRGVLVKLTAKGRQLADQAMPDHAQVELGFISDLTARQREQLATLLARLMKAQDDSAVQQLVHESSTADSGATERSTVLKSSARGTRRKV
jgi:DNA-binding MarR family transcriptional regulator